MKTTLHVTGMTCQNCVKHVREALQGVDGVQSVEVDLESGIAQIEHGPVEDGALERSVEEEGYDVQRAA